MQIVGSCTSSQLTQVAVSSSSDCIMERRKETWVKIPRHVRPCYPAPKPVTLGANKWYIRLFAVLFGLAGNGRLFPCVLCAGFPPPLPSLRNKMLGSRKCDAALIVEPVVPSQQISLWIVPSMLLGNIVSQVLRMCDRCTGIGNRPAAHRPWCGSINSSSRVIAASISVLRRIMGWGGSCSQEKLCYC